MFCMGAIYSNRTWAHYCTMVLGAAFMHHSVGPIILTDFQLLCFVALAATGIVTLYYLEILRRVKDGGDPHKKALNLG